MSPGRIELERAMEEIGGGEKREGRRASSRDRELLECGKISHL